MRRVLYEGGKVMPLEHDDLQPGCTHQNVVPSKRYEDGSIDGRCEDCGAKQEGFPIRSEQLRGLTRQSHRAAGSLGDGGDSFHQ